jgi:hypothetical protein
LCFASEEAAKCVRGKSWIAEAVRAFDIEVHIIPLPDKIKKTIVGAQSRQRMVNQS